MHSGHGDAARGEVAPPLGAAPPPAQVPSDSPCEPWDSGQGGALPPGTPSKRWLGRRSGWAARGTSRRPGRGAASRGPAPRAGAGWAEAAGAAQPEAAARGGRAWEPAPANPAPSCSAISSLLIKHPRNIKFTDVFSSSLSSRNTQNGKAENVARFLRATWHFGGRESWREEGWRSRARA